MSVMRERHYSRKKSRVFGAAVASIALTAALMTVPHAANANGYNEVLSHGGIGRTSLNVIGTSNYVEWADVGHTHSAEFYLNLCGYRSKVWGTVTAGYTSTSFSAYTSGCSWYAYYTAVGLYKYFQSGTTLKAQTYHDGDWAPGVPQVGIWA